ncbi:hypothetical protein BKA56DRAFT_667998 [Ilyonectria sp. MPI-CAGE-AT-0026]|nr:hypothetical protein BKA56DRAFT_667998 [Ilyonectria sp. MPI-CAGE-AT-0026]
MITSIIIILSAVLGVSAQLGGYAHRAVHQRRFAVTKDPIITATTTFTKYVTEAAIADASSSSVAVTYHDFCTDSKPKRASAEQIAYKGNTGTSDDYGCNIMMLRNINAASQYKYTARFNNAVDRDQACVCFNKIGPNGGINGSWKGNQAISFTLGIIHRRFCQNRPYKWDFLARALPQYRLLLGRVADWLKFGVRVTWV